MCTVKRPARIGCSPAWLIATQFCSSSFSIRGGPLPRLVRPRDLVAARVVLEISVDQPIVGPAFIRLIRNQNRRNLAVREQVVGIRHGFALRAGARHRDAPTHFAAASLARRWSRLAVSCAA